MIVYEGLKSDFLKSVEDDTIDSQIEQLILKKWEGIQWQMKKWHG